MAIWDELDKEDELEKDEEEANLSLMALTSSDTEPDSDSSLYYEEENEVFSKLSCYDLIAFIQDLMGRYQEKTRHMKILKKQYDLLKDELESSQNKNEALEKDHFALVNEMSDKPFMNMK